MRLLVFRHFFRPSGHVGLSLLQDVAVVLGVGVQPLGGDAEVRPQHVAALDDHRALGGDCAGALHRHVGVEPGGHPQVGDLLA